MKSKFAAIALAITLAGMPLAGAQACVISGAKDPECIARCYNIKDFWDNVLCSLGSAPPANPNANSSGSNASAH